MFLDYLPFCTLLHTPKHQSTYSYTCSIFTFIFLCTRVSCTFHYPSWWQAKFTADPKLFCNVLLCVLVSTHSITSVLFFSSSIVSFQHPWNSKVAQTSHTALALTADAIINIGSAHHVIQSCDTILWLSQQMVNTKPCQRVKIPKNSNEINST